MNFFRLRLINTVLVLFIGIVLGYLMKERTVRKAGAPYVAKYVSTYAAGSDADETPSAVEEPRPVETTIPPEAADRIKPAEEDGVEEFEMPVKLPAKRRLKERPVQEETDPSTAAKEYGEPPEEKEDGVVRGAEDVFFKDPARFSGRDLEMDLQMIMARRSGKSWSLNLVRSKGGKDVDYLYVDDESVVGDTPELKIGYSYRTRFRCRKGDTVSGNKLLRLTPTGEKASWATGVSAVE
ncbi:MAG: hypothetical protein WCW52_05450 [Elusimicrobiales bacterium]|jgi:hypothetical protein